jgi:cardiolipin synthase
LFRPAAWLFVLAGISDFLDGFLARRLGQETALGAWLDPVADKVLLVGLFFALSWQGVFPLWFIMLVIGRDAAIVSGVLWLRHQGRTVPVRPTAISKINTAFQMLLLLFALAWGAWKGGVEGLGEGNTFYSLLILTTATTILSGLVYAYEGWRLWKVPPHS